MNSTSNQKSRAAAKGTSYCSSRARSMSVEGQQHGGVSISTMRDSSVDSSSCAMSVNELTYHALPFGQTIHVRQRHSSVPNLHSAQGQARGSQSIGSGNSLSSLKSRNSDPFTDAWIRPSTQVRLARRPSVKNDANDSPMSFGYAAANLYVKSESENGN